MFERVSDPDPGLGHVHWMYRNGKVIVVALGYMFGQYRLQVWYDRGGEWPDILTPNC